MNLTPPGPGRDFESAAAGSANEVALMRGCSFLEKPDITLQCLVEALTIVAATGDSVSERQSGLAVTGDREDESHRSHE